MKTRTNPSRRWTAGFTLTEVLIASGIMGMMIAGVISAHIAGIRLFSTTKLKLGASDDARRAISKLIDEVRSAKIILVGMGSNTSFDAVDDGPQRGNAIQVYPTTSTNTFTRYYLDTNALQLCKTTQAQNAGVVLANFVTNTIVFSSEDYQGNVLTNSYNNRVIGLNLEFFQIQFPIVHIGVSNYFEYYKLSTKITRRTLE